MKHNSSFTKVLFVLLLTALFVLACGTGSMGAIATPVSTNTPASTNTPLPTNTATPKPTNTPLPTATEIPPTPTPVSMGTPVSSGDYEVNVMYMRTLETVYLDKQYHWVPTAGNMFIELGIKAKNLKPGSKISIPWASVYLVEEDGDVHYPNWGEFKPLAGGLNLIPRNWCLEFWKIRVNR